MNNYNLHLSKLRESKNLSLKEASKAIGISWFMLYLYESGYFRPSKKALKKLSDFYKEEISINGEDAYPAPNEKHVIKNEIISLKVRRIVLGALAGAFMLTAITGAILFNKSVNTTGSFYGEVYNDAKKKVQSVGNLGHDLVTSLEYRYVSSKAIDNDAAIVFYNTDSILYFNECTFSMTKTTNLFDLGRFHYQFGSNLGVSSNTCEFNYGSLTHGTYISCTFEYKGKEPIEKLSKMSVLSKGDEVIDEAKALQLINLGINDAEDTLSELLSKTLEKDISFYDDFLPAREKGRKINFSLQIVGLILIFSGIVGFFIFIGLFLHYLMKNIKPRLVLTESKSEDEKAKQLPKDFRINFGIPDIFVIVLSKVLQFGSLALLLFALLAKLGIIFPSAMANSTFLTVLQLSLLTGIFLEHFIIIGRLKKPSTLFRTIIYNVGLFLFIATTETVLISITNSWGYNLASLIIKYVPGNVYQVVALHYLIYLFLFFQPSFLKEDTKIKRLIWHSLSIIPLGGLIASYFLSNNYVFVYGVKENIFVNFWFPNGFLPLSIVCVLFLYITFGVRLFFEKKYGQHNAQYFFYGDRYGLYENLICAGLILIVGLLDLLFKNNQYAYYLGLGNNVWVFTIIPLIILCKYSPNSQQIFLINREESDLKR